MIPPSYVDNFYDDPDQIVNTALGLKYYAPHSEQNFAGLRTECISQINYDFFNFSVDRFLYCFFDMQPDTMWEAAVHFHKNYCYDQNHPHHPFNLGWIHKDDDKQFKTLAGVIYLNKKTYLNSGTSIYNLNGDYNDSFEWGIRSFNRGIPEDEHLYADAHHNHNKQFDIALEFKNRYNRMVAYDGYEYHSQSCLWVPGECRLTQLFFIRFVSEIPPLKRYHPSSLKS